MSHVSNKVERYKFKLLHGMYDSLDDTKRKIFDKRYPDLLYARRLDLMLHDLEVLIVDGKLCDSASDLIEKLLK